ncbi:MAG: hypothetical protein A2174_02010 [Candidatus Portnoybacteria bacterium RBG_13_41_18]|uniref:LysM domain-containing protein n=1 Tax=Candidatus Portnoybacteria bacterium RBG_13_41_18 TaxID=1801991 RepID=A0A1G2F713_9BACT|nr:MAG: hypothetical protein A2174_02010 [Candidatus Portnoybacteria bacterium RBG_13_41_18]
MSKNLKINRIDVEKRPINGSKSLKKVIFRYFWRQRTWIGWLAVIFFVFFSLDTYGIPPFKDESEKPHLFIKESTEVVLGGLSQISASQESNNNLQEFGGVLGGPAVLNSMISSGAQNAVDYSLDDEYEDYELLLMQDSAVISLANPSGTAFFSGYRREILTYKVKQGDVPERIAAAFGVSSDTLLAANGLRDGDIIKPGQELVILPINGVRIKVAKNETLESIAKKYKGDKMEIIAFNDLPLDATINIGDYLIVPDGELPTTAPKYTAPTTKFAAKTTLASSWLIYPTSGRSWGRLHSNNGVDVANPCGTPIYAAAAGKVILSDGVGYNGGYGKYIKIQHPNGIVTLYAHASQLLVSEGQQVGQGQLIMLMGTTGRSTGCHLHFEVRGGTNPLKGKSGYISN